MISKGPHFLILYWLEPNGRLRHRTVRCPSSRGTELRQFAESECGPRESAIVWDWPNTSDVYMHKIRPDIEQDFIAHRDRSQVGFIQTLKWAAEYRCPALYLRSVDECVALYPEYEWTEPSD